MDFKFSEEDEKFRLEFRGWLEQNLPRDWRGDNELDADSKTEFERRRDWHRFRLDGETEMSTTNGRVREEEPNVATSFAGLFLWVVLLRSGHGGPPSLR